MLKDYVRKKKNKTLLSAYALVLPAFIVVLAIVAYPIINSIIRSFQVRGQDGFTLENYIYFFTTERERANIFYTLFVVVITAVLSTVIAYGLALYLRFVKNKVSGLIGKLYLIPRFIPGMVATYAVMVVIKDTGVINRISLLFSPLVSDPSWEGLMPNLMFNTSGLVLMNLWFNIPFSAMLIASALSSIPDSVVEGARDVGASRLRVFFSMILPLSIKDVMVAATFVFMGNVGSFTTAYLIMGSTNPKMLGISLFDQFTKYGNMERTATVSVIMFLICSISAVVYIYTNLKEREWEKQ